MYDAGGLPAAMALLIHHHPTLHKDTTRSCMNMVTRLVPRVEPKDSALEGCVESLSILLQSSEPHIADPTLKCFMMLADRFIRRGRDPAPIAEKGLVKELIGRLMLLAPPTSSGPVGSTPDKTSGHTITTIISLLSVLCRGSPVITRVCIYIVLLYCMCSVCTVLLYSMCCIVYTTLLYCMCSVCTVLLYSTCVEIQWNLSILDTPEIWTPL